MFGEACRKPGISEANDNWRKKNSRLKMSEILLRRLKEENDQLRKIATGLALENETLRFLI